MTGHTYYSNGIYTCTMSRGGDNGNPYFAATASSDDETTAKRDAIYLLNEKTKGVYAPMF